MLYIILHCNIYQWLQTVNTKSENTKNPKNKKQTKIIIQKKTTAYNYEIQLKLDKLKTQEIAKAEIDLTRINIKTLTTKRESLNNDVKLMMTLPSNNRHYVLNDRTINLLMKGKLDMNAVTGEVDAPKFSDAEISSLLEQDTEI